MLSSVQIVTYQFQGCHRFSGPLTRGQETLLYVLASELATEGSEAKKIGS
jgi:hypothetical protein